jgi:hypothetical protein
MKRTLSLLAIGAVILMPAIGRADDSIGEKVEDVVRGIGQGIKDAAHDVKQAVTGRDVEVSLGERHMDMPTSVEAGDYLYGDQRGVGRALVQDLRSRPGTLIYGAVASR